MEKTAASQQTKNAIDEKYVDILHTLTQSNGMTVENTMMVFTGKMMH